MDRNFDISLVIEMYLRCFRSKSTVDICGRHINFSYGKNELKFRYKSIYRNGIGMSPQKKMYRNSDISRLIEMELVCLRSKPSVYICGRHIKFSYD